MRERNEQREMIRYGQRLIGTKDDGIIGNYTIRKIEQKAAGNSLIDFRWKPRRKLIALIQFTALSKGIEVGKVDGLVGPQTHFAFGQLIHFEKYDKLPESWRTDHQTTTKSTKHNPHGFPTYKNIKAVFGEAASGLKTVLIPFTMKLAWDVSVSVKKITCHKKVAPSLLGVLEELFKHYSKDGLEELGINLYGGCFNKRKMRGGSKLSTHSWGAAVDLHPAKNQLRWNHKKALFAKEKYQFMLDAFAKEGWVSLGAEKDYDWMHFQAVQL